MKDCWANSLGDCGEKISREHFVSKSIFLNQLVYVQGFDWCLGDPVELPIESVTGKILCKHHNETLSELDAVAGAAFRSLREWDQTRQSRAALAGVNWIPKQFEIDARKLERWCLKTLLNLAFTRGLIIGPGDHQAGVAPSDLVRIVFGLETFTEGRGLYIAYRENETFTLEDGVRCIAKARDSHLMMEYFVLYGFRFYLNLMPATPPFAAIEDSNVFYRRAQFIDPVEPVVEADGRDSIQSLIRRSRSYKQFRQKISFTWTT